MIPLKSNTEIERMRQGGKILSAVLIALEKKIKAGVLTLELAEFAKSEVTRLGAEAAFLGYSGFPSVICISVNDTVVHGVPGGYVIKNGDIVSLDFGVKYLGLYTDAARSYLVGSNDSIKSNFIKTTNLSLEKAIQVVKEGSRIGDIGSVVQKTLEDAGYGVVRDLVGHGVGRMLHEDPNIPNYGISGTGPVLKNGMVLAIEPMSTMGDYSVKTAEDGWSVLTRDGSLSAHFEDTILVTKDGSEILTR
jgi:methionyl aminopeptidase